MWNFICVVKEMHSTCSYQLFGDSWLIRKPSRLCNGVAMHCALLRASPVLGNQHPDSTRLMERKQGKSMYDLPAELLSAVLAAVDPLEDLLHLSTSCRLLRTIMNRQFWQKCLDDRSLEYAAFEDPRKKAIYYVTNTCSRVLQQKGNTTTLLHQKTTV